MIQVYLSGKITGLPKEQYTLTFAKAEQFYKGCGYTVINPVKLGETLLRQKLDATYEDFMKVDLIALKNCTHIALLEGWEDSKGAQKEKQEAEKLGLEIMYFKEIGGKK